MAVWEMNTLTGIGFHCTKQIYCGFCATLITKLRGYNFGLRSDGMK